MSTFAYTKDQIDLIFETANKQGKIRKDWLDLDGWDEHSIIVKYAEDAKTARNNIRKEIKKKNDKDDNVIRDNKKELDKIKTARENVENEIKSDILRNILDRKFEIEIEPKLHEDSGKTIYVTGQDRDSFFACKIINEELQKIYKIEQPNRNDIVKCLKLLLSDRVDKLLVRCDIKSFFETIDRERLLRKLKEDNLVSRRSLRIMKRMFYKLSNEYGYKEGIPRGIAFAQSLADIYLHNIDEQIRSIEGVYFYRRYVDDVIIIASPLVTSQLAEDLFSLIAEKFKELGLEIHSMDDEKSLAEDIHYGDKKHIEFDFLGYHIDLDELSGDVAITLTQERVEKYRKQIRAAVSFYNKYATIRPRVKRNGITDGMTSDNENKNIIKRHRQPLYKFHKLLGYLTRNYSLGGTKSNIYSGIYFKHPLLTDTTQLKDLDEYLYNEIDRQLKPDRFAKFPEPFLDNLKKRIHSRYSFVEGYNKRRMCRMTSANFRMIKKIMNNHETEEDRTIDI